MGFLSRFEGKVEDTFEGAADKMFDAPISPVQIAKKAEKQMRREKMVGAGKQYAPTLYTVLVNPDDDGRLFGYYPTLAGETETYLSAKASQQGLAMDGQPLVRFIVDEDLKHGKFDVIAEAVAAPIIKQLRQEEMQRYGLAGPAAVQDLYAEAPRYAPLTPAAPYVQPSETEDYHESAHAKGLPSDSHDYRQAPLSQNPYLDLDTEFEGSETDNYNDDKPPLPYVPEDELDYSIDYGQYTFDSQNFEDENGKSHPPQTPRKQAQVQHGLAPGASGGAGGIVTPNTPVQNTSAAGRHAGAVAADTVVFANGAGGVNAVPNQKAVRASLIDTTNNRTYSLASSRLLLGRESKNDIVVQDINASRTHAELRYEPQGVWVISDLGSTNGTQVNGADIESQALREGDRITIGMTNFLFTFGQ